MRDNLCLQIVEVLQILQRKSKIQNSNNTKKSSFYLDFGFCSIWILDLFVSYHLTIFERVIKIIAPRVRSEAPFLNLCLLPSKIVHGNEGLHFGSPLDEVIKN